LKDPGSGRQSTAKTAWHSPAVGEVARVARFGLVGALATAVYFLTSVAMVEVAGLRPVVASVVGQACSAFVSYFGHATYSFRARRDHLRHGGRFLAVAAATFGLNVLVTWFLTEIMPVPYWIAFAAVVVMIPTVNYLANRFWVFGGAIDGGTA
jgi:putative flippase GtrA